MPTVPPALSAIVLKLLAKVAEERYQSAEGLKADLERCREALSRGAQEDFPLGEHDTPHRFQLPQRLYGRDAQVAALLQGFERVGARRAGRSCVLVSGYSGIGKSAVVHELHKPVVQRRGFFLSGKFDQFQRDIPYATLAQAIRGLVQQLLGGHRRGAGPLARAAARGVGGPGPGARGRWCLSWSWSWASSPPLQELPPAEAQHRFHRVFRQFLRVFATPEHPLVVFLDDLQWADLASLRLLQHLLTQPETPPVLLIGAYRDNEVSPSHPLVLVLEEVRKAGARMTDIRLEPLSLGAGRSSSWPTRSRARRRRWSRPSSALVHEKTGGNPFFLLQFMLTLNQDGLLVRTPEGGWRWDAEGVRARGYSDNVVDFMVGKLRQLPAGTQHLLRLAACVGNVFSLADAGHLSDLRRWRRWSRASSPRSRRACWCARARSSTASSTIASSRRPMPSSPRRSARPSTCASAGCCWRACPRRRCARTSSTW